MIRTMTRAQRAHVLSDSVNDDSSDSTRDSDSANDDSDRLNVLSVACSACKRGACIIL